MIIKFRVPFLNSVIRSMLRRCGMDITKYPPSPPALSSVNEGYDAFTQMIQQRVAPYTMTGAERVSALIDAVRYVQKYAIEGAFVECGVWRGGSAMAMALTLTEHSSQDRDLYLYDTFTGMTQPDVSDISFRGESAIEVFTKKQTLEEVVNWCYASLEDVSRNLNSTMYPSEKIHYIKGKVEDTIPGTVPDKIAILRLDTDWYDSTRHELEHLFPKLAPYGVLIIDDYGHWEGARKAVDEYIEANQIHIFLSRIDYTGRLAIKTESIGE